MKAQNKTVDRARQKGEMRMSVQERLLLLQLSERIEEHKEYAEKIGVSVVIQKKDSKNEE